LLRPWILAQREAGYEVHIACARTNWFELLAADGFCLHEIPFRRRLNPFVNIIPLMMLYRLIRSERFALVNLHTPVAAAVGRVASWLARVPAIIYVIHGFYFHDDMAKWKRQFYVVLERLFGRITGAFMFVSDEDRRTALRERIARDSARATTIYNGVDLGEYPVKGPGSRTAKVLSNLGIPESAVVVGIVSRVVKEKGYLEFAQMAELVSVERRDVYFLVVGGVLASDRDGVDEEFHQRIEAAGLLGRFRFTGFTDEVADYLQAMDIFVLPSYREGFPRSVLEAMSCGLPVVTTNIRGCREAVVQDETGLIVPPRNSVALARAVTRLLEDPGLARRMGLQGRARALLLYDQKLVQQRFMGVIQNELRRLDLARERTRASACRLRDIVIAGGALLTLAPILVAIAAIIRLSLRASPVFTQLRVGINERPFTLYKFRTMTEDRDSRGILLPDELRLTRLGRFLRRTSIDELPQLWNILKGDMSLVGPRPLLPEYLPRYTAFQRRRHEVKPGITGWAQINGRNALTWEEKFNLDVWYVDHQSLRIDFKILWMTLLKVLKREGISQDGHATMPEFMGSPTKSTQDV
jgi:lipopolysaccharide/colanic/teichoic acid biosynthesis glycosyltransferase/glycosyltransferase involved in cell wall biosynthesis